jgi:hypothetical protein
MPFDCGRKRQSRSIVDRQRLQDAPKKLIKKLILPAPRQGRIWQTCKCYGEQTMDMQPPPALVQIAQAEVPPDQPVEPTPIKVDVSKYIPESATAVTMIVTLTPPTGQAVIYPAGHENEGTLFKGPRSIDEVKLTGPIVYVKLYGATSFDIQYTNYRQPY